jgi:regulation of enolase protein 1 (concanavalin A-like superfamily)
MKPQRLAGLALGLAFSFWLCDVGCDSRSRGGGGSTADGAAGAAGTGGVANRPTDAAADRGADRPAEGGADRPRGGGTGASDGGLDRPTDTVGPASDDAGPSGTTDGGVSPRAFTHPGIPLTMADLNQLKANLNTQPWKAAYALLLADPHSQLSYVIQGPFATVSRTPDVNLGQYGNDMQAVFNLARLWVFTGNTAYAQRAHDILLAWATTHTSWGGAESYLTMGDYAYRMYGGADILRGTWPGWSPQDTATCKAYFNNVYWSAAAVPSPLRSANQGVEQLITGVGVAVFNDDLEKFNQCLQAFRADAVGGLADSLSSGVIGDSGRDEGHAYGELMHLSWIAEVFWKQGVDVYSELDNRLLAAGEFYSRYNLGLPTPFMQFGSEYDIYPSHGAAPESSPQPPDVLNLIYGAYAVRKGLSAPYVSQYRSVRPETADSFVFRKSADLSTAAPPAPLIPPAPTASVTTLNGSDIGGATPPGSATYRAATWTLQGAGTDIGGASDSFHFAYRSVTGNATIIARVMSVQNTAGDAKAGVMIRESLASNANMMGLYMLPQTTINANTGPRAFVNMRGQTASSHNASSQTHRLWDNTTVSIPYWLKLERVGNRITAFHSTDGASWSTIQCADFPLSGTVSIGLAVSSRVPGTLNVATFTNVRITGADGAEVARIPDAPFAIYGDPGDTRVPLRWLEAFGATRYLIKRSTTTGGPYTTIATLPGTSYVDSGLSNGTAYHFVVSAANAAGESGASPEEIVSPAALTPP